MAVNVVAYSAKHPVGNPSCLLQKENTVQRSGLSHPILSN